MKAILEGVVVASSEQTIIIEGNHYFPPADVHFEFLTKSSHTTHCPWKGEAHYYDVQVGDKNDTEAAWYYPTPKAGSIEKVGADFSGYVAFWKNVKVS